MLARLLLSLILVPVVLSLGQAQPRLVLSGAMVKSINEGERSSSKLGKSIVFGRYASWTQSPLLPVLFFERGSATFPSRYRFLGSRAEADHYVDTQQVIFAELRPRYWSPTGKDAKYYQLLDVVGYRMRRSPSTRLKVRGEYSSEEGESEGVARLRAEAVRDHLTTVWGIARERVELEPVRLGCSEQANRWGQEEARRVVLTGSDTSLLAPVQFDLVINDFMLLAVKVDLDKLPNYARSAEYEVKLGDVVIWRETFRVGRDLSNYTTLSDFHGVAPILWATTDPYGLPDSLRASATVELVDGQRLTLTSSIPVVDSIRHSYRRRESNTSPITPLDTAIPFYNQSDTVLFDAQRQGVAGLARTIAAAAARPNDRHTIDSLVNVLLPEGSRAWRGYYEKWLKGRPVLTITATTDPTERGVEPGDGWRPPVTPLSVLSSETHHRLLDRSHPPQLLARERLRESVAEERWIGFDVEQRFHAIRDSLRNVKGGDAGQEADRTPNRQHVAIVRRRNAALLNLLRANGVSAKLRVALKGEDAVDVSSFASESSRLPEQRYAMRSIDIRLEYPEPPRPRGEGNFRDAVANMESPDNHSARHNPWTETDDY